MPLDPSTLETFRALALGLAAAGLTATAFEWLTARRASFALLETGDGWAFAAVPILVFSAPFVILRNTVRGGREGERPFALAMLATIIACGWGLLSGRVVLDLTQALAGA